LEQVSRKLERLMRRRPRGLIGPAGALTTLLGVVTLQSRDAIAGLARRRWRRALRRRAETRAELRDLQARAGLISRTRADLTAFLASDERLSFQRTAEAPSISVIIAVWNQAHFVLRCLRGLLAQDPAPSMEIVLVDNASGEETQALLSRVDGVTIIRNSANQGYLLACNQGSAAARGRAILLLNTDAFVRAGALSAALATLESNSEIGAVGGRLIMPNGRLQEAGCYITADGTPHGRFRGLPPDAPEAMVRCDVDYCSGAFLMIKTALWRRLAGFETVYGRGYYEEADFCLRLKAEGYRVIVEPDAAADHFEFGSEGEAGDALRESQHNRLIFVSRHAATLLGRG
jgi:GT2 family glycosyltransferase